MIQGKLLFYGDDLKEVYEIRTNVFIDELDFQNDDAFDDQDIEAIQVLVYEKESSNIANCKAVATGRIIYKDTFCIIDKIAVLKEYRRKAYGDFTVRMLLNKAFTAGIHEVQADVTPETFEFFKTIGFTENNEYYKENNSETIRMKIMDTDMKSCCGK